MTRLVSAGTLTILLLSAGFAVAQIQEATHSIELTDAAGDVDASGDNPGKDVVGVAITTDGEQFAISVTLAAPVESYLKGHMAGDVVEVILDTDNDASTGGKPFFYEGSGFEFQIEVGACIEYDNGGTACAGGLGGAAETGYFSTYALQKFTEGSQTELVSEPFNWRDRGFDIDGNTVEVSLPYAAMNLQPGQKVRIAVKENDDATFKKEYLPEVLLTLK